MAYDPDEDDYPYGDPPTHLSPAERGAWLNARDAAVKYDTAVAELVAALRTAVTIIGHPDDSVTKALVEVADKYDFDE